MVKEEGHRENGIQMKMPCNSSKKEKMPKETILVRDTVFSAIQDALLF